MTPEQILEEIPRLIFGEEEVAVSNARKWETTRNAPENLNT